MKQLDMTDASFIYFESPHAPVTMTGINVYDPSTAPGGKVTFKGILDVIAGRLHKAGLFRQKLVTVPMTSITRTGLTTRTLTWRFHVRHFGLPKPGDWRQFCIQVARLHSQPVDMSRPMWEMYVIEGLDRIEGIPPGSFAVVTKLHHAAVDGKSGMDATSALHDPTPDVAPAEPDPWRPERTPSGWELAWRAGVNNLTSRRGSPRRWSVGAAGGHATAEGDAAPRSPRAAPAHRATYPVLRGYRYTHAFDVRNTSGAYLYDLVFATINDAGNRIMRDVYAAAAQRFERMRAEAFERRRARRSGQESLFDPENIGSMTAREIPPYQPDPPSLPFGFVGEEEGER